jgi:predicted PurR-regulated permease PerM
VPNDRSDSAPAATTSDTLSPPGKGAAVGIGILACIAVAAALFVGREFFLPIAFAFTINPLFRPIVRRMEALRVPTSAAAAVIVLALIALIAGGAFAMARPLKRWFAEAPQTFEKAEQKLARLREPIRTATNTVHRIERAADMTSTGPSTAPSSAPSTGPATQGAPGEQGRGSGGGAAGSATPASGEDKGTSSSASSSEPQPVTPQVPAPAAPGFLGRFLGTTTSFVGGVVEVLVLLFLLLASGDLFYTKLLKVMPRRQDKREAAEVVGEAERVVIRYVAVTAMINVVQASIVALLMWWLGMPSPLLWGLFTFVFEFIPYLGATIMIVLLSVVAFATLDGIGHILAVPGSYLLVTTLQNNVASPLLYGDHLKLNPVAVLIGVLLWWFLWGIGGAFLAVPIIATIKIVCAHTRSFNALSEFLGE